MKKKGLLVVSCCLIFFFLCGCEKKETKNEKKAEIKTENIAKEKWSEKGVETLLYPDSGISTWINKEGSLILSFYTDTKYVEFKAVSGQSYALVNGSTLDYSSSKNHFSIALETVGSSDFFKPTNRKNLDFKLKENSEGMYLEVAPLLPVDSNDSEASQRFYLQQYDVETDDNSSDTYLEGWLVDYKKSLLKAYKLTSKRNYKTLSVNETLSKIGADKNGLSDNFSLDLKNEDGEYFGEENKHYDELQMNLSNSTHDSPIVTFDDNRVNDVTLQTIEKDEMGFRELIDFMGIPSKVTFVHTDRPQHLFQDVSEEMRQLVHVHYIGTEKHIIIHYVKGKFHYGEIGTKSLYNGVYGVAS